MKDKRKAFMLTSQDSRLKTVEGGFTIVELMIATVVFSMTLMLVAAGFVQIGRMFYKGITTARTQEIGRTTMDDVSRNLQFSSGQVICVNNLVPPTACTSSDTSGTLCIGSNHYLFNFDSATSYLRKVPPELVAATTTCGSLTTGSELLTDNMRLVDFTINCLPNPGLCSVDIVIASGDEDVLNVDTSTRTASCKSERAGNQFCAVTNLATTINRRIQ